MKLFIFSHPDLYNATIVVIASNEEHARDILEDSQHNLQDYSGDSFTLLETHNLSSGVKYYTYE